jgi:hypothetical protein
MSKKEAKAFFDLYGKDIQKIAWKARELVFAVMPEIAETVYPQMKVIRYGLDGNKMSGLVCAIIPAAKWVSLGFMHGTSLPAPEGLLEGTGKGLRHIKLRSLADVDSPAVRNLVEAAREHKQQALSAGK